MSDILNKTIVLVLNRNWQAINIRTPQEAFCQMATNVATALEIDGENHIRPVTCDEWITLPIRDGDNASCLGYRRFDRLHPDLFAHCVRGGGLLDYWRRGASKMASNVACLTYSMSSSM